MPLTTTIYITYAAIAIANIAALLPPKQPSQATSTKQPVDESNTLLKVEKARNNARMALLQGKNKMLKVA